MNTRFFFFFKFFLKLCNPNLNFFLYFFKSTFFLVCPTNFLKINFSYIIFLAYYTNFYSTSRRIFF